jgi:putative tryptophan/tyrosine transport system substrate-binding protein
MKRRHVSRLLAGASLWPLTVHAQSNSEAPKVGFISTGSEQLAPTRIEAIVSGLKASGHALPQVEMVVRVTGGDPSKLRPMVAEVIARKVSVLVAAGPAALRELRAATSTLPIIAYDFETDPVAEKYAQSIARPGGNVTGVFLDLPNFSGKWIELLRELVPQLSRIALIWDPATGRVQVDTLSKIAGGLNIQTDLLEAHARSDFAGVFAVAKDRGAGAIILLSSPLIINNVQELAQLERRHRLPVITLFSEFPRSGGLISYGPNLMAANKQAGVMAGKVLAGSTPATMPIERPSIFELIVNRRAAEELGLAIPASIEARADEVIE